LIIDAHHHFWNPARVPQTWMTAEHAALDRAFEPADLAPLLDACRIDGTVLVQSAASDADTDYMFEVIDRFERVRAVTAWLPLDDPDRARRRLAELRSRPRFRAVRHLIHQEPDPHWILRPELSEALDLLQRTETVLELPAVFPDHLADVPELARRYPGLTLVLDHLAKPPLEAPDFARWQAELQATAAHPNVVAKVSGLNTAVDFTPSISVALAAFGPARLLFGSDWPVSLLNGAYEDVVARTVEAIHSVAGADADALLGANAVRIYRLEERR
jgi:L-fuconolactonase